MKTYTLTVTQEQLDTLAGFINESVKHIGLGAVRQATLALDALEGATEMPAEEPAGQEAMATPTSAATDQ